MINKPLNVNAFTRQMLLISELKTHSNSYPADQRCQHKLLQQRGENLAFHIFQGQWRRLLQQIRGGRGEKLESFRERCVCLGSTHVVDSIKQTLILASTSAERRPGFLGRYWCRKKTSIHNLLDTTQLFQMPLSELGYLLARSRNHIFWRKKEAIRLRPRVWLTFSLSTESSKDSRHDLRQVTYGLRQRINLLKNRDHY